MSEQPMPILGDTVRVAGRRGRYRVVGVAPGSHFVVEKVAPPFAVPLEDCTVVVEQTAAKGKGP